MQEIKRTEVPEGMAMAQWALGWGLQHPAVSCVAGARSVEQVQSNADAGAQTITDGPFVKDQG